MNDIKIIEANLNDAVKLLKELPVEQGELIHDYVDYALKLVKKHDFIGDVSEPLQALKKIVADNTIKLLGLTANNQFTSDLRKKTEFAIKSIEAIK